MAVIEHRFSEAEYETSHTAAYETQHQTILRMTSILKSLMGLVQLQLVVTGCAHTVCLKVIDASTGRPLAGVSASWQQTYHGVLHYGHEGPTNLPSSGENGFIKVGKLHRDWSSTFIFTRPGYSNVYGGFTSKGKMLLGEEIRYFPPGRLDGQFYLKGRIVSAFLSNQCFVVPLPKSSE